MRRRYIYPIIAALLLGIVATASAIKSHNDARLSANALVAEVSRAVLATWDPELLLVNAHTSLLEVSDASFYRTYFNALRRLGTLETLDEASFTLDLPPLWEFWDTDASTGSYTLKATFSEGDANITIKLLRENGRWWFTEYLVLTALMAA